MPPLDSTSPPRRRERPSRAATTSLAAAPRISLGDVVAEQLREAILNDELTPGQHLLEEEISDMLQVSRGPVRDAFILLEREGLVRLSRHRGASVVDLSATDLGEVYSLRSAIEELAVRLAIRRHNESDLEALDGSLKDLRSGLRRRLSAQEAARLDVEFHDAVFRAAHHDRLYASWSAIRMQVYLFLRRRHIANADWRLSTVKGHSDIVDLIKAGDENAAATAIRSHICAAYARVNGTLLDGASSETSADEARVIAESYLL